MYDMVIVKKRVLESLKKDPYDVMDTDNLRITDEAFDHLPLPAEVVEVNRKLARDYRNRGLNDDALVCEEIANNIDTGLANSDVQEQQKAYDTYVFELANIVGERVYQREKDSRGRD
ncbi:MAG: hypothetical protein WAZ18_01255 [Alphaproteobacteria bacterium]